MYEELLAKIYDLILDRRAAHQYYTASILQEAATAIVLLTRQKKKPWENIQPADLCREDIRTAFEDLRKPKEINQEELLKALAYDRDQYDKGFRDGRLSAEVESEWTEENTCSHCGEGACAGYDEEPWRTRYCPHCGAKMKNPEAYE